MGQKSCLRLSPEITTRLLQPRLVFPAAARSTARSSSRVELHEVGQPSASYSGRQLAEGAETSEAVSSNQRHNILMTGAPPKLTPRDTGVNVLCLLAKAPSRHMWHRPGSETAIFRLPLSSGGVHIRRQKRTLASWAGKPLSVLARAFQFFRLGCGYARSFLAERPVAHGCPQETITGSSEPFCPHRYEWTLVRNFGKQR
jgi:hypothetical protein